MSLTRSMAGSSLQGAIPRLNFHVGPCMYTCLRSQGSCMNPPVSQAAQTCSCTPLHSTILLVPPHTTPAAYWHAAAWQQPPTAVQHKMDRPGTESSQAMHSTRAISLAPPHQTLQIGRLEAPSPVCDPVCHVPPCLCTAP